MTDPIQKTAVCKTCNKSICQEAVWVSDDDISSLICDAREDGVGHEPVLPYPAVPEAQTVPDDRWAKGDQEKASRLLDAFIETVNADHNDFISISRAHGCLMRDEIERLRRAEAELKAAREEIARFTTRTGVVTVASESELTCDHKRAAMLIGNPGKYCCYVCWLEAGMDEADDKLEKLRNDTLQSAQERK